MTGARGTAKKSAVTTLERPPSTPRLPRERLRLAALAAALGISAGLLRPGPPQATPAGLAEALGRASQQVVSPADVRWEPSRGFLLDALVGRQALFLASSVEGGPRDLHRARVRVSREGHPVEVVEIRNLTRTPLGDDHALVVKGERAAYATYAFGQEQSVSALDLRGEGAQNLTTKLPDRVMSALTNWQQTGSLAGIGRVDVTLDQPARRVGLALADASLAIELADDDGPAPTRRAEVDLARLELAGEVPGMHAQTTQHLPKRPVFWAVDTVRAVPWIGPAPIAWMEERAFAARDTVRQLTFKVGSKGSELAQAAPEPPRLLTSSEASEGAATFPPPKLPSIWKTPQEGEGEWVLPVQPWVKKFPSFGPEAAPSMFYRTYVRPDEERPYAKVLLVIMDMRQLDLAMEGGIEDPKPAVGATGAGRIPREPAVFTRVASAFNGGFKTEHGNYGMMVRRRVLLPPQPGAASVLLLKDGRVGMGSWGNTTKITGLDGIDDSDIVSFRQNLDPLLDGEKVNPTGRSQWGFTLPGTSMQTERSGICVTGPGHLVYAWGDDVSATTLGKAMKMAGCTYGMHLDMNPHHTGLIFTNITELKGKAYKTELLSNQMEISADRYIEYAPKDFFYVMVHDPAPPPVEGASWAPDPGLQPAPRWYPGLWTCQLLGVDVSVVEPGRAAFRIRAGTREPQGPGGEPLHELTEDDGKRVLFAVGLGASSEKRPRGLAIDGKINLAPSSAEDHALLVASEDGALEIRRPSEVPAAPAHGDYAELPLVLDARAPDHGPPPRAVHAALGTTPDGRVYIARSSVASKSVIAALSKLDCDRAVALERGLPEAPPWNRAGTPTPPRARYEGSALYAMGKPLVPRGFHFAPKNPMPVGKPGSPR